MTHTNFGPDCVNISHWRVADRIGSVTEAGLSILEVVQRIQLHVDAP